MKYYKEEVPTDTYVTYWVENTKGEKTFESAQECCFAKLLIYHHLTPDDARIVVERSIKMIPYDPAAIMWFVMELNKMGFPMKCEMKDEMVRFILPLEKYKYRLHMKAALTLTRCLWESHICHVAGKYFELIEKDPKINRFKALQMAHKTGWGLNSHAAIADAKSPNITWKTFMANIERNGVPLSGTPGKGYWNELHNCFKKQNDNEEEF